MEANMNLQEEKWVYISGKLVPILKLLRLSIENLETCRSYYAQWLKCNPSDKSILKRWSKLIVKAEKNYVEIYNLRHFSLAEQPPFRVKEDSPTIDYADELIPSYLFQDEAPNYSSSLNPSLQETPTLIQLVSAPASDDKDDSVAVLDFQHPGDTQTDVNGATKINQANTEMVKDFTVRGYVFPDNTHVLFDRGKRRLLPSTTCEKLIIRLISEFGYTSDLQFIHSNLVPDARKMFVKLSERITVLIKDTDGHIFKLKHGYGLNLLLRSSIGMWLTQNDVFHIAWRLFDKILLGALVRTDLFIVFARLHEIIILKFIHKTGYGSNVDSTASIALVLATDGVSHTDWQFFVKMPLLSTVCFMNRNHQVFHKQPHYPCLNLTSIVIDCGKIKDLCCLVGDYKLCFHTTIGFFVLAASLIVMAIPKEEMAQKRVHVIGMGCVYLIFHYTRGKSTAVLSIFSEKLFLPSIIGFGYRLNFGFTHFLVGFYANTAEFLHERHLFVKLSGRNCTFILLLPWIIDMSNVEALCGKRGSTMCSWYSMNDYNYWVHTCSFFRNNQCSIYLDTCEEKFLPELFLKHGCGFHISLTSSNVSVSVQSSASGELLDNMSDHIVGRLRSGATDILMYISLPALQFCVFQIVCVLLTVIHNLIVWLWEDYLRWIIGKVQVSNIRKSGAWIVFPDHSLKVFLTFRRNCFRVLWMGFLVYSPRLLSVLSGHLVIRGIKIKVLLFRPRRDHFQLELFGVVIERQLIHSLFSFGVWSIGTVSLVILSFAAVVYLDASWYYTTYLLFATATDRQFTTILLKKHHHNVGTAIRVCSFQTVTFLLVMDFGVLTVTMWTITARMKRLQLTLHCYGQLDEMSSEFSLVGIPCQKVLIDGLLMRSFLADMVAFTYLMVFSKVVRAYTKLLFHDLMGLVFVKVGGTMFVQVIYRVTEVWCLSTVGVSFYRLLKKPDLPTTRWSAQVLSFVNSVVLRILQQHEVEKVQAGIGTMQDIMGCISDRVTSYQVLCTRQLSTFPHLPMFNFLSWCYSPPGYSSGDLLRLKLLRGVNPISWVRISFTSVVCFDYFWHFGTTSLSTTGFFQQQQGGYLVQATFVFDRGKQRCFWWDFGYLGSYIFRIPSPAAFQDNTRTPNLLEMVYRFGKWGDSTMVQELYSSILLVDCKSNFPRHKGLDKEERGANKSVLNFLSLRTRILLRGRECYVPGYPLSCSYLPLVILLSSVTRSIIISCTYRLRCSHVLQVWSLDDGLVCDIHIESVREEPINE